MTAAIEILFVTLDPERAERVISGIRMRGTAVRARQASDRTELDELLASSRFDTVVLIESGLDLQLEDIRSALHQSGRQTPAIVITSRPETERLAIFDAGAFGVVGCGQEEVAAMLILKAVEYQFCCNQLHRTRNTLQEAERRYLLLLDSSRDPIAYVQDGIYLYANDAWREFFQIETPEDLARYSLDDFIAPEQQDLLQQLLDSRRDQPDTVETTQAMTLRDAQGRSFEAQVVLTDATVDGEDCTVLRVATERSTSSTGQLSVLDPVTGLYNRRYLIRSLEDALVTAARSGLLFALIDISIDDFASIRIERGLSTSDILLADLGVFLRERFPAPATVARLRGEEFGVLVPNVRRAELEPQLDTLIRDASERPVNLGQDTIKVTLSCGVVIADNSVPTAEHLLARTTRALEQARSAGGNRCHFHRPEDGGPARTESDQAWHARIEEAMANDRLRLLYQPVVNLHGADVPRFNVFVRLFGPEGQIYQPNDFLPAAERTGIAAELDRWIIRHAIEVLAQRLKQDPKATFFLKLTRGSLNDGSVVVWLQEVLHQHRVPAGNVVVEIKEATIITNLKAAIAAARGLKAIHSCLCIDDFGNGLNPFHILRHVDADYIKLDGAFVRELVTDANNQQAIRRFTDAAHAKGKQVIVPRVEDAATLAVLFSLNVNLVQGYFVHPPSEQLDFDFTQVL
ncbi:EAL domain-containing response regulator [Thioalkalivibrio paradoxus]|uniref:Diguanylate cyclase n=1 Tax=Thioalkalivibrio paradoxus ARh 1 TaxID=713585 RepID=W0DTD1_9GAMM|nr:EAL domain-containing protein [Thioalkalivibrio paradoxus]AHF00229.1 hypothetical protein THITH_13115 [Thioalkalivibrio paradoxus ARh 1]